MKKKWKKEDLNSKHIEFSNKEEQNKLIKFLNSFGLKEEFEKNRGENDNCFYVSGSSDFYFTDNVKECELKYSDIFPEESFKQEQQFIVGKWHKLPNNINKAGNVIIYIKLKNITSDGYQEYSHRIVNNKGYEEYHDEVKTKIELLTDLSEIQQYLPSNHPDKVNTASKQYQYEVVHCKTQQEWDFVIQKLDKNQAKPEHFKESEEHTILVTGDEAGCYERLSTSKLTKAEIYSFEEWCNKFNYKPDFMKKEETNIEKAKRLYPIGTEYMSLASSPVKRTIMGEVCWSDLGRFIIDPVTNFVIYDKNDKKWAEIVTKQPLIKEEKYKVGNWVKLSNTADGWGAPTAIRNAIVKITSIDMTDTIEQGGRVYFDFQGQPKRTVMKEIERFALPHEIPQESNSSIPTYVEWINNIGSRGQGLMGHESYFKQGKIFCTKTDNLPGCGLNSSPENWGKALTEYWYSRNFKPSTKEAYDWQNGVKEIFKHYENIQLYPVTKEQCYNGSSDIIEVGDEVEVINANSSNWYSNGVKYKVINVTNNGTRIHTDNDLSYWIQSNHCKVIKKASQIQHNERKVDEQLPNIAQNYEILDIFKPKSSKTMDFTAFQQQSPKELGKISKNKHLTI